MLFRKKMSFGDSDFHFTFASNSNSNALAQMLEEQSVEMMLCVAGTFRKHSARSFFILS